MISILSSVSSSHNVSSIRVAREAASCFCVCLFALATLPAHAQPTRAEALKDPILNAMQQELDRERDLLQLPGLQRPYFIEYRLDDYQTYNATATFGALTAEDRNQQRIVRVTVRIGDYTADSSSTRVDGSIELGPEDNDPSALRYALWTTTDEAYKNALRAYATKQAQLKRFEKAPTEKDFSTAPATITLEPILHIELDANDWKRRLIDASGVFSSDLTLAGSSAQVQYSSASLRGIVINRFVVNSEGTILRHGTSAYNANFAVNGQADDGMRLDRNNGTTAAVASQLESAAAFHRHAVESVQSFYALRNAPVADAEDFHGPVLFHAEPATDILNRLFVTNVSGERPEMGTTARTLGPYQSSFRSKVLPEIFDVVDDPRLKSYAGQTTLGAYDVDDEGVPAQAVTVVEHGKLTNYLTSRTPIRDFPASNGHGRASPAQAVRPAPAVMLFKSASPIPAAQLHQKLVAMAKEQGRDVYEVDVMSNGEMTPRLLYRVHPDGTRQLVRGAVFDELDRRSLRSEIVAAGDDPYVNNSISNLFFTTVAPSLLFGDIGVKRATEEQQKLPYYAPPATK
jgi:TldD protein